MKKIRAVLMTVAFLAAITGAFAFKAPQDPCASATHLYYKSGSNFIVVPTQGGSCGTQSAACKYYNAGTDMLPDYEPCNTATYGKAPFTPNP